MILKNGKRIDGCSDTVPVGSLNPFLGTTAPFGYLICQGQKVSKTTYPELYEICGSTFGTETSTEFYLPDLRGQTIAGYKEGDSTFGTLGGLIGEATHTLTVDEMPSHKHDRIYAGGNPDWPLTNPWGYNNTNGLVKTNYATVIDGTSESHNATRSVYMTNYEGGSQAHNNIQPTMVLNWIVKAFPLMPNQSTVVNTENDSTTNVYSTNYINELKTTILDSAFPVGKVEVFFDNEDHSNYLGFTWVRELEGLTPVGYSSSDTDYNTIGKTLGSKTHSTDYTPAGKNTGTAVIMNTVELTHSGGAVQSHTLTLSEIPSHQHNIQGYNGSGSTVTWTDKAVTYADNSKGYNAGVRTNYQGGGNGHTHGFTQPSKHSFTPSTKSVTQPTFTGTKATISMDTRDPQKVVAYWRRVS